MRAAAAGIDFFIYSKTGVCRSISAAEVFFHRFFFYLKELPARRERRGGGELGMGTCKIVACMRHFCHSIFCAIAILQAAQHIYIALKRGVPRDGQVRMSTNF